MNYTLTIDQGTLWYRDQVEVITTTDRQEAISLGAKIIDSAYDNLGYEYGTEYGDEGNIEEAIGLIESDIERDDRNGRDREPSPEHFTLLKVEELIKGTGKYIPGSDGYYDEGRVVIHTIELKVQVSR